MSRTYGQIAHDAYVAADPGDGWMAAANAVLDAAGVRNKSSAHNEATLRTVAEDALREMVKSTDPAVRLRAVELLLSLACGR